MDWFQQVDLERKDWIRSDCIDRAPRQLPTQSSEIEWLLKCEAT
jgi:hypothetical protein